ncbi:hypothetical protein GIB67_006743, partial [Kingdonia uniflora]
MGLFKLGLGGSGAPMVCPQQQHCSQWAQTYINYCLCTLKDGVSLTLGLISVLSWGVAEVPQIITNYKQKSAEGLSIAFLMMWTAGDIFNLVGCLMEPATQTFITMAWRDAPIYVNEGLEQCFSTGTSNTILYCSGKTFSLDCFLISTGIDVIISFREGLCVIELQLGRLQLYTVTTIILAAQTIYYGHIYHRLKAYRLGVPDQGHKLHQSMTRDEEIYTSETSSTQETHLPSQSIPVNGSARYGSYERNLYYTSARSLSKSFTPIAGSVLAQPQSYEKTNPISILKPDSVEEPLLGDHVSTQSAPPLNTKNMLCVVSAVTFFLSTFGSYFSTSNKLNMNENYESQGVVIRVGRKLLETSGVILLRDGGEGNSGIGTFLGWVMAAIYMGGRLPQIYLNIRRGHVKGLNPLMFVFALVGNVTYVASILVNSLEWSTLKPNLPWLVDAGGCVILDTF